MKDDFDSPWKEVLTTFFRAGLELCFPKVARQIEWAKGFEFLDAELQKITPAAELGRRTADKLVKVWRRDGQQEWVLVHVEVQARPEKQFVQRMFQYHIRIYERFNRQVASLAILADAQPNWRPQAYEKELWGCRVRMEFPVAKLLELAEDEHGLLDCGNPFGVVILSHVKALRTRGAWGQRRHWKWELVRGLYERKYSRRKVQDLFRFIDWVMTLPKDLSRSFARQLIRYEKVKCMPYVTSIERWGEARGRLQSLREATLQVLEARFGEVPYELRESVATLADERSLKRLLRRAAVVKSLTNLQPGR
jgi:hypothetical protein